MKYSYCLKIFPLPLLAMGILFIAGCFPVHPSFDSYTRKKPVRSEVIGSYKAASQKLILLSDGSFMATGIPATPTDTDTRLVKGQWRISSYSLSKDEGGGAIWHLEFTNAAVQNTGHARSKTSSRPFPGQAALLNSSKPYDILFEYDAEGDQVLLLEKY